jgi:dCTP deaminase
MLVFFLICAKVYILTLYIYKGARVILTGTAIEEENTRGAINITPFDPDLLNPNSYNYRLGEELLVMEAGELDIHSQPTTRRIIIPEEGYVLQPNTIYLGHTYESIGSTEYVPSLIGRSSLGRLGLFLQITADLGHIGTGHKWTLELKVVQPLRVYPGMRIGQVSFWQAEGVSLLGGKAYREQTNSYAQYSNSAPSMVTKFFE